jgi:hypothetical protein
MKHIIIADGHAGIFNYFRVQTMGRRFAIVADTVGGREVMLGSFVDKAAACLAVDFIMECEAAVIDYRTLARDAVECIESIKCADGEEDFVSLVKLPSLGDIRVWMDGAKEDQLDKNFRPAGRVQTATPNISNTPKSGSAETILGLFALAERENG